ncbi:hypothetical protein ES708_20665 [subsurface metagenome]
MSTNADQDRKIYEVTLIETGEKSYQAATTSEDACKQAGWLIGSCYVKTQVPRYKNNGKSKLQTLARIPCLTCPFQYAECKKPTEIDCPVQPNAPDLQEWLKQAGQAHLCDYCGQKLSRNDYHTGCKWLPLLQAIEELGSHL